MNPKHTILHSRLGCPNPTLFPAVVDTAGPHQVRHLGFGPRTRLGVNLKRRAPAEARALKA